MKVGVEEEGYTFDLVSHGDRDPVAYRAGKNAFIDDLLTSAPNAPLPSTEALEGGEDETGGLAVTKILEPAKVAELVAYLEARYNDQIRFYVEKLSTSAITKGQQTANSPAATKTAFEVMNALMDIFPTYDLIQGVFHEEGLAFDEVSFQAYAAFFVHYLNGAVYPKGGMSLILQKMADVVRSLGGGVVTKVEIKEIVIGPDKAAKSLAATGVKLENGTIIKANKSVISSLGVIETVREVLPEMARKHPQLLLGLNGMEESRPRFYTMLILKGTAEDLNLSGADYVHVPDKYSRR